METIKELFGIPGVDPSSLPKNTEELNNYVAEVCSKGANTDMFMRAHQLVLREIINGGKKSCMVYHSLGSGKSCTAITAVSHLLHRPVWIVTSETVLKNFKEETKKCLSGEAPWLKELPHVTWATYGTFSRVAKTKPSTFKNAVLVFDEAHRMRDEPEDKEVKKVFQASTNLFGKSDELNIIVIMLTATPVFNAPEDMVSLLWLLAVNDGNKELADSMPTKVFSGNNGRSWAPGAKNWLQKACELYVSYVQMPEGGEFPIKLWPSDVGLKKLNTTPKNAFFPTHPVKDTDWVSKTIFEIHPNKITKTQNPELFDKVTQPISNITSALGNSNVWYPGRGFQDTFTVATRGAGSYKLKWASDSTKILGDEDSIKRYAPKIHNIVTAAQKSRGPIVVYTNFNSEGAIPLCVALETMGFSRYGTDDIINTGEKHAQKYIVISGDAKIMKRTKATDMVKEFNREGSEVKVAVITSVASEGISFKRARELHVLDPWFHYQRLSQVVARAIRFCSHATLPIEERNVTVFFHALEAGTQETPDLYIYRIVAEKLWAQTTMDAELMPHALDCELMSALNNQPPIGFRVPVTGSRGRTIKDGVDLTKTNQKKIGACKTSVGEIGNVIGINERTISLIASHYARMAVDAVNTHKKPMDISEIAEAINLQRKRVHAIALETGLQQAVESGILVRSRGKFMTPKNIIKHTEETGVIVTDITGQYGEEKNGDLSPIKEELILNGTPVDNFLSILNVEKHDLSTLHTMLSGSSVPASTRALMKKSGFIVNDIFFSPDGEWRFLNTGRRVNPKQVPTANQLPKQEGVRAEIHPDKKKLRYIVKINVGKTRTKGIVCKNQKLDIIEEQATSLGIKYDKPMGKGALCNLVTRKLFETNRVTVIQ